MQEQAAELCDAAADGLLACWREPARPRQWITFSINSRYAHPFGHDPP